MYYIRKKIAYLSYTGVGKLWPIEGKSADRDHKKLAREQKVELNLGVFRLGMREKKTALSKIYDNIKTCTENFWSPMKVKTETMTAVREYFFLDSGLQPQNACRPLI